MSHLPVRRCRLQPAVLAALVAMALFAQRGHAAGEPAEEFLKRLRAARYFDTAISYLDRLDQYPGIKPELLSAVDLEKAQTYIDAAVASRSTNARDEYFQKAEAELTAFLQQSSHPRASEARLQLGKLQMVRAAQLMVGKPDASKRTAARESYLAASKTFDTIVERLRGTLKDMQGARIDPDKEPEKIALRDQYRGEYLQALSSAGESRLLAARTFQNPKTQGKDLLEKALTSFTDLSEKYDSYVQGAVAMLYRAQVQDDLGMKDEAIDSYMRMLEHPDADPLRDAKYQATDGLIKLWLTESPANYQSAIDRGKPMIDDVRPNERSLASVQSLRVNLGRAYLAKAKDEENQKSTDLKRAESEGRQLLIKASKIPGEPGDQAKQLLADMGIDLDATAELPTTDDPNSLEEALELARELVSTSENLSQSLKVLEDQKNPSDDIKQQIADLKEQLVETRVIAIQILRRGLALVNPNTDNELVNQARQSLAYLLYVNENFRESVVVGTFLCRNAPKTEVGLRGGLLALNSLQLLLADDSNNDTLVGLLEDLGNFLGTTWPDDPDAAAAQGVMIMLSLRGERWGEARALIEKMGDSPERASYQRLIGQLLWNESIEARKQEDEEAANKFLADAAQNLRTGLDSIQGNLIGPNEMKAALTLAKVYLKQNNISDSANVLDHETYGPVKLIAIQGDPGNGFASELYSTELQVVVQRMTSDDGDSQALLNRASEVMEKLRASVQGPDAQDKLTGIYMRMAREIREQLDSATPQKQARLIEAFRVFLDRIAKTTKDPATLQWVGQTLMNLSEVSMPEGATKAQGQAAELLKTAADTFRNLKAGGGKVPLSVDFQLGKAERLQGNYKASIDTFEKLLTEKPMMLDAQMEAALAYEQWAATLPPKFTGKAYESALGGARPNAQKKNTIWGWGKISQLTSRDPKFREMFFEARYHVALCRYLWGKAINDKAVIEKSVSDITKVNSLYPKMGGAEQRGKFDRLLKLIQKELGQQQTGLPPLNAA